MECLALDPGLSPVGACEVHTQPALFLLWPQPGTCTEKLRSAGWSSPTCCHPLDSSQRNSNQSAQRTPERENDECAESPLNMEESEE